MVILIYKYLMAIQREI